MPKINIAILGATGAVGQRLVSLLADHPYFKIQALLASEKSAGKTYEEACRWILSSPMPDLAKKMILKNTAVEEIEGEHIEIVFSALPSDNAKIAEPEFARAGYKIFSNASAFRNDPDVPLMITEINTELTIETIKRQQKNRGWKGFIITKPNCTTIILCMALKPLYDAFGIKSCLVSTMQALSGAGYPGVPSLDIIDNVIPFIEGEDEKVEDEPAKILGVKFPISATCHRVGVVDGHLEDLKISLGRKANLDEVKKVLAEFARDKYAHLPSGLAQPIIITGNSYRPQPRLDRDNGNGMAVTIGRIRECPVLENGIRMTILGHNTLRGAAGLSVLSAEWWVKQINKF